MLFAIASSILGIIAFLPLKFYFLGFIFLLPFFYFLVREEEFGKIFWGTFLFRALFSAGSAFYAFELLMWTSSWLIFLGLAPIIFILNKVFFKYKFAKIIYVPVAFLCFDLLEAQYSALPTYILTAGNLLGASPFAGLAKYGGILALEFFVILVNSFFLVGWLNWKTLASKKIFLILALISLGVFFLGAWWLADDALRNNAGKQTQANRHLNVTAVSVKSSSQNESDLSAMILAWASLKTDLLVLPEELFVKPFNQAFDLAQASETIKAFNSQATYIVSTFRLGRAGKIYNTALLFNKRGDIIDQYDKNKLVLFGEYWPYTWRPPFYDFLKEDPVMQNYALFDPENSYEVGRAKLLQGDGELKLKIGTLICVEGYYASMLTDYRKMGAELIINPVSNNWLSTGQAQFYYLSSNLYRIESIQAGLPIIVSGIDSFAGIFLPDGSSKMEKYAQGENYKTLTQDIKY